MKNILTLAIIGAALATPVFAQTANDEAVASDVHSLNKDNNSIGNSRDTLANQRAKKAADKANDNTGSQAVDSAKIAGTHTAIGAKKVKKSIDKQSLSDDKANMSNTTNQ